jgi:ubiquinone/menaquinone biosynthesis C-methylase UbiE
MAGRDETYTPGYTANASDFMAQRRAATHAAFFTLRLRSGMHLLDCGCGPGTLTVDLAEIVAPGEVVGVDREATQVEAAQTLARRRGVNARFEAASVYELPFPDWQFDAAFSHALFEHLGEPLRALDELKRVLKPGGFAGLRSPDWGGFLIHPSTEPLDQAIAFYKDLQTANGGDVTAGRKLGSWLRQAGFRNVTMSAAYEIYREPTQIAEYLARQIEPARDARPEAGSEHRMSMAAELRRWSSNPDAFFAQAWCEAVGFVE